MKTKSLLLAPAAAMILAATASAQVDIVIGPNPTPNSSSFVDFDAPAATPGAIGSTDPFFTSAGIASVNIVGTWTATGDVLNVGGINVVGQSLTVTGGALAISIENEPLDGPDVGSGIEFTFTQPVDEFGFLFTDQQGFTYDVELFSGATSLGVGSSVYPGYVPPVVIRGSGAFDRVLITFPVGSGGLGFDQLSFGSGPGPAPLTNDCVESVFVGGNGGNVGGGMFFDLTATQATSIGSLMVNYQATQGASVGLEIYTTPGTRTGAETDPTMWTLAATDDGTAVGIGDYGRTEINLASAWNVPAGSIGVCLVAIGSAHRYTDGDGTNEVHVSGDGVLTLDNPGAQNVPFSGGTIFQPRVANVRLCPGSGSGIGSSFCAANNNTTGLPGLCSAVGSTAVADNDVTLQVSQIPPMEFGIFTVAAAAVAMTPVNQGILCLSGPTGRYSMPGQIWQANGSGQASLAIDLTMIPTPTALVSTNPGDTWFFQAWHRDLPPMVGAPGSNFTTGVEITFN